MSFPTDTADINECTKRFNRLLLTTNSYVVPLSSPPKRRSFNSDDEIQDLMLEADELFMYDVRNTLGHPWAPTFFDEEACGCLCNLSAVPASDAPIHKVTYSADGATFYVSEEVDKADIIEAVRDYTLFGTVASDSYGFHNIVDNILYTTSPFNKITQANWSRLPNILQSPITFTTAIIMLAISLAPKDGLDVSLLTYAEKKASEFRQMIRNGAMLLPEVTKYGLSEVAG